MSTNLPEIFTLVMESINPKTGNLEKMYTAGTINPKTKEKMTLADYISQFFGWKKIKVGMQTESYMSKKNVLKLLKMVTRADLQRNKIAMEAQAKSMEAVVDELSVERTVNNTNRRAIVQAIDFGKSSSDESYNAEGVQYNDALLKEMGISEDVLDDIVLEVVKLVNIQSNAQAQAMEDAGKENLKSA